MGQFSYEDGELKYSDAKKGMDIVIGNFWIEIQKEIVHIHEICNEQNIIYDYKKESSWRICIYCMGQCFETEKTKQDLLLENQILKMTQDRGYIESGGECKSLYKKYVNQLIGMSNFDQEFLFDNTGWTCIPEYGWQYLNGDGIIGDSQGNIKANVPYHFYYKPEMVGRKEIFDEFLDMRNLSNNHGKKGNSVFLMHFSGLAEKTTLYQNAGRGINFLVALTGPTNSQKTTVGKLFSRLFDRTSSATADIRFNSTEVAIMEKMEMYGDAILMVDDFVPYSAKGLAQEQRKKLEVLIRSYGDREPRKRSKIYAKINDVPEYSPVKGCCLVTGEIFQTESESSDTRVVQLSFEPGDVDLNLLTYYQENLLNFSTFHYDYICFTRDHIEMLNQIIEEEFKRIRGQKHKNIHVPRFVDTLAIMSSEVRFFYTYAVERGFMNIEEAQRYIMEDMDLITQIIEKNDQESKIKSPATTICLALKWAIEDHRIRVCSREDMRKFNDFSKIIGEDENYIYILPEALWQIYRDYSINVKIDLEYENGRELSSPLRKENIVLIKVEGKEQKRRATHHVSGIQSKKFFYMKKSEVKKLLETYEKF